MVYNITGLEKTQHESPEGLPLYIWQNLGTIKILTDGYNLYAETTDRKGINPIPIAEGKPGYVLTEASPIDQFFISLKEEVKNLAIDYIKANPDCILYDVVAYIEAEKSTVHADLAKVMLTAYVKVGVAKGLFTVPDTATEDEKFLVLRDFIVNTSDEELQAILNS